MAVGALALAACQNDSGITEQSKRFVLSPELQDLEDVVVGETASYDILLTHSAGTNITITDIDVQNVEGSFFSFDGSFPQTLEDGGTLSFTIEYTPTEAGYHRAQVHVISDAKDGDVYVEARGRGVLGAVSVRPLVLDFGVVQPDETVSMDLIIANDGLVPFALNGGDFSAAGFAFDETLPVVIDVDDEQTVHVEYTATTADVVDGTLDLDLGGFVTAPTILLRANDCENGAPSAYDTDHDGYTSCHGDCDDTDGDTHPGGVEVADGADQDCDGVVDEGTELFDDDGDGYTEDDGDCNDGMAAVNPSETEDLENGVDDDCDGVVDYGTSDADADGYSEAGGDCDDTDGVSYPGAPEIVDAVDNDCDGIIDEGTTAFDDDGDGQSEAGGDCDDSDVTIGNAKPELADWVDNDCDGEVDENTVNADDDHDGFSEIGGDCDDADDTRNPGQVEIDGNGQDDDCDGLGT